MHNDGLGPLGPCLPVTSVGPADNLAHEELEV